MQLLDGLIVLLTIAAMELVAWASHKYVMHGFGWAWHASHHGHRRGWFEKNDLYAFVFAGVSIALIWFGTQGTWPLQWIGAGMAGYGLLYFIAHDGLVHGRWPFQLQARRGYLKRLVQAHRLHHAIAAREAGVSFGFLLAPSQAKLAALVHATRNRRSVSGVGRQASDSTAQLAPVASRPMHDA